MLETSDMSFQNLMEAHTMEDSVHLHRCCYYARPVWVDYNGWTHLLDMEHIDCSHDGIPDRKCIRDCYQCQVSEIRVDGADQEAAWNNFFGIKDYTNEDLMIQKEVEQMIKDAMGDMVSVDSDLIQSILDAAGEREDEDPE